jgi:hypothetical protein
MDKRYIESMGNRYMKNAFLTEEPEVFSYEPKRIPIGTDNMGNLVYLEMEDAIRALVIGMAGAGKTFLLRGMIDRLKQCPVEWVDKEKKKRMDIGYSICYLSDIKDELKSSKDPVQPKFRNKLLAGETPIGLKVISCRPTFFREFMSELPSDNLWMSINIAELQKRDFMTLLKGEQMTEAQQTMLEVLYDNLKKKPEFKLTDIPEMIDQLSGDFKPSQLQALKNKFKPILNNQFGDPRYVRDVKKALLKDYVLSINFEGQDFYSNAGVNYPPVFLGIVLRNIIYLRRQAEIKPLFLFLDEAARFVPESWNPSCKHDILESIDIDRRYFCSWIVATQSLHDMPEKLIMQSRYMFIPYNADTTIIKEAISAMGLALRGFVQNIPSQAQKIRQSMRKHQWVLMDRVKMRYDIITVLAPLSNHMESR